MKAWVVVIILIGFVVACQPEPDDEPKTYIPTPYNLSIPPSLPQVNFPADNPLTVEGVALGRKLFWDPILSADSTQSCASCHAPEFAFTDNGLATSTGIRGMNGTRNSMPIMNLMYSPSFFWDGRAQTLHHQALMPIEDPLEMDDNLANVISKLENSAFYPEDFRKAFGNAGINEDRIGLALEQFMLTFISGDSKFDRFMLGQEQLTPAEQRGMAIFNGDIESNGTDAAGDCFHCHGQSVFSNNLFMNNGLDSTLTDLGLFLATGDENDKGKFKVPSLRNIDLTGPYMHDGRFQTLFEVIDFYDSEVHSSSPNLDPQMHGIEQGLNLSPQEKSDLLSFLSTLTDSAFVHNPDFQSPF